MKFKKILSAALAAVMAASVMSVGMVSVASAAEKTYYYYITADGTTNTENKFTAAGENNGNMVSSPKATFTGEGETELTFASTIKCDSSGKITFTVTGKSADIEVLWAPRNDPSKATEASIRITASSGEDVATDGPVAHNAGSPIRSLTKQGLQPDTYTIQRVGSGGEPRVYGVKLVETISDAAKEYTASGNVTGAEDGDVLSIDGNTATVAEGKVTFTTAAVDPAPFAVGQLLDVVSPSQKYQDTQVEVASLEGTAYTLKDLELTKWELAELDEKEYQEADITAGKPNFDLANSTHHPGTLNRIEAGTTDDKGVHKDYDEILFKVKDNATVTIKYTGTSSTKTGKAIIVDSAETVKDTTPGGLVPNKESSSVVAEGLAAGTYAIRAEANSPSSSTSVTINSVTVAYGEPGTEPGTDPVEPGPTPSGDTVLAGSGLENILGADFATAAEKPEDGNRTGSFEKTIFTDASTGESTGVIANQHYIVLSQDTVLRPTNTGTLNLYVMSQSNDNARTFNVIDSSQAIVLENASAPPRTSTGVRPISFHVDAGETYTVTNNQIHLYAAELIADDALTPTPVNGDPNDYYIEDGNTTYIIHAVTETEKNDYQSLVLEGDTANKTRTDTVYQSVLINGQTIKASAVNSAFLYAIKVTDSAKVGAPASEVKWANGGAIQ